MPIASITKMMTVWVVLQKLPLTYSESGPCLTVNSADVALWDYDVESGQSNVKIVLGERLCEGTLLRGMLVHSAGDYAQLLTTMLHMSQAQFVNVMNKTAKAMGLTHTHYVDYTGINPGDLSTPQDQAKLATTLMDNEPIVRSIVRLPEVNLPVVGEVVSYTPFEGIDGVVGVKSGFTGPAGGCDVMAVNITLDDTVYTTYAVVLGVHGADAINRSGEYALALSHWLSTRMRVVTNATGTVVKWIGWPGYVVATTTTTTTSTTSTSTTTSTTSTTSTTTTTIP
jgi:D-alanyl-D-alanine carboxypeptidase (penicillin-binding protein 5/6)